MQDVHLSELDWNLLRVLDALLQTRSPTHAADRLGLSQSAVSHALARLREVLGDDVLVRHGNRMVPTARAAEMGPQLAQAIEQLAGALAQPEWRPLQATRTFRLMCADYAQQLLLPPLLDRLRLEAPQVDLWVLTGPVQDAHRMLAEGQLDMVFGPANPLENSPDLHERRLFDESFVCVVRKGHPQVADALSLEQFVALPHVFVAPGGTKGGVVDVVLGQRGLQRRVAVAVPNFLLVPQLIAGSDLIGTLALRLAERYAKELPLQLLPPPVPLPGFTMMLRWHARQHRDPGHVWLRRLISEVAAGV